MMMGSVLVMITALLMGNCNRALVARTGCIADMLVPVDDVAKKEHDRKLLLLSR
jgi:hypothetical protein